LAEREFSIPALDQAAMADARRRQDSLTKPLGALGVLEEIACRLAGIQGNARPRIDRKYVVVAAADHGVALEGVSAYPPEVTGQMLANFLNGGAAINVLARFAGAEVLVVDAGVASNVPGDTSQLRRVAVRRGTSNMAKGPAMARDEAWSMIDAGAQIAHELADEGAEVIATAEMGIGNTTPAAAITSVFTGRPPELVTGRGTGVDEAGFARKVDIVRRSIERNRPDPEDPLGVLAAVGGFEIAFMAGLVLGAAERRVAVALDGFISTAAALAANGINPAIKDYAFATHRSAEAGHAAALERLGMRPMLELDMRLGEGSGAALGFQVMEAAVRLHNEMATFEEAAVSNKSDEA
jgi:nicotinate-nucleotide--dimethylbenzimidazole phosphoribosyltransferase